MKRLLLTLIHFANPKRGDTWTCPVCGDSNDEGRAYCMNGCGTPGPLAPERS